MDQLDDLFSKDGWVITKNINGKTKVANCNDNETNPFNKTRDNWVTLNVSSQSPDAEPVKSKPEKTLRFPFLKVGLKSNQINGIISSIGFYLIRDLLNLKKPNSLSKVFLANNVPVQRVVVCARITSYEQKNTYFRLILDDGTSSILCLVKIQEDNNHEDSNYQEELDTSCDRTEKANENCSISWTIRKLRLQRKNLTKKSSTDFDSTSLGKPIRIVGDLNEFCGKNFIFANNVKWVTQEYFVNFLSYVVQDYEYKENYMMQ